MLQKSHPFYSKNYSYISRKIIDLNYKMKIKVVNKTLHGLVFPDNDFNIFNTSCDILIRNCHLKPHVSFYIGPSINWPKLQAMIYPSINKNKMTVQFCFFLNNLFPSKGRPVTQIKTSDTDHSQCGSLSVTCRELKL